MCLFLSFWRFACAGAPATRKHICRVFALIDAQRGPSHHKKHKKLKKKIFEFWPPFGPKTPRYTIVVHVLAFLARISPKPLQIKILMKTDDFFDRAKPADAPKHQIMPLWTGSGLTMKTIVVGGLGGPPFLTLGGGMSTRGRFGPKFFQVRAPSGPRSWSCVADVGPIWRMFHHVMPLWTGAGLTMKTLVVGGLGGPPFLTLGGGTSTKGRFGPNFFQVLAPSGPRSWSCVADVGPI